jgi:hypothetical protein
MNQHKRIITELARCEEKLDTILFDTDQATGAAATGIAGLGGLGGLYAYGRRGMKKGPRNLPGIGATIGRGASKVGGDLSEIWKSIAARFAAK